MKGAEAAACHLRDCVLDRPSAKTPVSAAFPRGVSGAAAASAGVAGCRLERGLVGARSRSSNSFSSSQNPVYAPWEARELASAAHRGPISGQGLRVRGYSRMAPADGLLRCEPGLALI